MAKQPKKTQTDWTRGGKAISDTAIPLYQTNLNRMDTYLQDPTAEIDKYLDKYYTNTASQNDFLRNYQKTMGNVTGSNYAATGGGISSLNQGNYADYQRYMNDLASRLQEQGVNSAYNMAQGYYGNLLNANNAYNQAYQLGKSYSDVQQYNDMVDQINSNWWAPVVSTAGTALSAVGLPQVGAPLSMLGNTFSYDTSALGGTAGVRGASAGTQGLGLGQPINNQAAMGLYNLFGGADSKYNWLIKPNTTDNNPAGIRM